MPRAAMNPLQMIWECRWSRFTYRPNSAPEHEPPESLWVCLRERGIRRPVTEDACVECAFWEPQEEPAEH